jgi:hypothetical protein
MHPEGPLFNLRTLIWTTTPVKPTSLPPFSFGLRPDTRGAKITNHDTTDRKGRDPV